MPPAPTIAVFADTRGGRHYLTEIVHLLGWEEMGEGASYDLRLESGMLSFAGEIIHLPLKASRLLALLRAASSRAAGERHLSIGTYTLDTYNHLLTGDDGNLRLTEKESAILQCLHDARGKTVARQALLDRVWGYAESVETHTLETHIYRLRQKIEKDPSLPSLLLTKEDGYALAL